jgi:PTK7 protein tyrosine kinase 7
MFEICFFASLLSGITDPVVQLINTEKQKNNLILKCYVDGSDLIEIEWFRNDKKLIKSHDVHIQNRKLIIKNIHNANDNGYYRCAARNKAGAVVSKNIFKLNNNYSDKQMMPGTEGVIDDDKCSPKNPNLCRKKRIPVDSQQNGGGVRKMDVLRVKEGLPTILNCQYTNNQNNDNLIIKWRKDGKVYRLLGANSESSLDSDITSPEGQFLRDDSARIYINRENNSLVFQTTTSSDDGVYECELTDSDQTFTMNSNATELQIIAQLKFTPKPTARLLELGSIGKIHCKAQGTPVPLVKWELDDGKSLPDSVDDINGTLVFKNVTFEHRGNYTCVASNVQGVIKAAVAVNVVIAPR